MDDGFGHAELLGDGSDGEALFTKLTNAVEIENRRRPATVLALTAGPVLTLLASDAGDPALFGCHPAEDGNEQFPDGPGHVEPGLPDRDDLYAGPIEGQDFVEVATHRTTQPVDGGDDQHLVLAPVSGGFGRFPLGPLLHR